MDLSSYIPVYVRADGDDENDGLTVGNAKATVQAAYNAALALVVADGPASFTVAGTSDPYDSGTYVEEVSTINGRPSFKPVNASICVLYWNRALSGDLWFISGDFTSYPSTGNPAYPETATWLDGVTVTPTTPVPKYVLDIGAGTFAGVVLAADWNWRIAVRGAGATSSFFGGIVGDADAGVAGFFACIVGDSTVNLGAISLNGGDGEGAAGGAGGHLYLVDSIAGNLSLNGAYGFFGGIGGSVFLYNSVGGNISAAGGDEMSFSGVASGAGGKVSLVRSSCGTISVAGGFDLSSPGTPPSLAGTINVFSCQFTSVPSWVAYAAFQEDSNTFTMATPAAVAADLPIQNSKLVLPFADVLGAGLA